MTFRAAPGVRWRQVAGETVLLDLGERQYFALDEVGTFTWERLERGEAVADVVAAVVAAFEVDAETARRDLEALVADLVAAGLLVPA